MSTPMMMGLFMNMAGTLIFAISAQRRAVAGFVISLLLIFLGMSMILDW